MKIFIVGTSNTVIGLKGYVQALKLQHEVICVSSGRTPFFCALKTIIKNKEVIENCDLLILDHYVNDVNFYSYSYGKTYRDICEKFYRYLSSINVNIINLFFPIYSIEDSSETTFESDFYFFVRNLSSTYKIPFLDLNQYPFLKHHYKDRIHLNTNASYALGIVLGNYLQSIKSTRDCLGGDCVSFPFEVLMPSDFNTKDSRGSYKNSLLNIEYLDLRNKLFVERNDNDRLLSVGYLKPKDYREESGIVINNTYKYGFSGSGYFHEAIDINISGSLEIEPLQGEDCVTNLMKRGRSSGNFSFCYIADLLFYNPSIELICKSAYRECVSIELPYLLDVVERLSPRPSGTYSIPNLRPKSINRLRDIAIEIESEDLVIAKDFMFLSSLARPQGKLIKRKLNLYRSKLGTESD